MKKQSIRQRRRSPHHRRLLYKPLPRSTGLFAYTDPRLSALHSPHRGIWESIARHLERARTILACAILAMPTCAQGGNARRPLTNRRHQMLIGRASPHHVGALGIGVRALRIGVIETGVGANDHDVRSGLDPMV